MCSWERCAFFPVRLLRGWTGAVLLPLRAQQQEGKQSRGEASSSADGTCELLDAAMPEALGLLSYVNPFVS